MKLLCLYYIVNVLWYLYEVSTLKCFRRLIWGCDRTEGKAWKKDPNLVLQAVKVQEAIWLGGISGSDVVSAKTLATMQEHAKVGLQAVNVVPVNVFDVLVKHVWITV